MPVLGYLVEFDALPGLGNDTVPTQTPAKSGNTNGHGCGHNLIGTSSIGAAIALKNHMEKENIPGTIKVLSIGHKAGLQAAHVLAAVGLDLMTDPDLLQAAKDEFEKRRAGKPYKTLNDFETNPLGKLSADNLEQYECAIHGAMAHFGIKERE